MVDILIDSVLQILQCVHHEEDSKGENQSSADPKPILRHSPVAQHKYDISGGRLVRQYVLQPLLDRLEAELEDRNHDGTHFRAGIACLHQALVVFGIIFDQQNAEARQAQTTHENGSLKHRPEARSCQIAEQNVSKNSGDNKNTPITMRLELKVGMYCIERARKLLSASFHEVRSNPVSPPYSPTDPLGREIAAANAFQKQTLHSTTALETRIISMHCLLLCAVVQNYPGKPNEDEAESQLLLAVWKQLIHELFCDPAIAGCINRQFATVQRVKKLTSITGVGQAVSGLLGHSSPDMSPTVVPEAVPGIRSLQKLAKDILATLVRLGADCPNIPADEISKLVASVSYPRELSSSVGELWATALQLKSFNAHISLRRHFTLHRCSNALRISRNRCSSTSDLPHNLVDNHNPQSTVGCKIFGAPKFCSIKYSIFAHNCLVGLTYCNKLIKYDSDTLRVLAEMDGAANQLQLSSSLAFDPHRGCVWSFCQKVNALVSFNCDNLAPTGVQLPCPIQADPTTPSSPVQQILAPDFFGAAESAKHTSNKSIDKVSSTFGDQSPNKPAGQWECGRSSLQYDWLISVTKNGSIFICKTFHQAITGRNDVIYIYQPGHRKLSRKYRNQQWQFSTVIGSIWREIKLEDMDSDLRITSLSSFNVSSNIISLAMTTHHGTLHIIRVDISRSGTTGPQVTGFAQIVNEQMSCAECCTHDEAGRIIVVQGGRLVRLLVFDPDEPGSILIRTSSIGSSSGAHSTCRPWVTAHNRRILTSSYGWTAQNEDQKLKGETLKYDIEEWRYFVVR